MRRRQTRDATPADGIPLELRAGRCIEVWAAPGTDPRWSTARRFDEARDRWLAAHGLSRWDDLERVPEPLRSVGSPWSFDYLAQTDPGRLKDKLRRCGLPARWRPVHMIEIPDYGPSLLPAAARTFPGWQATR